MRKQAILVLAMVAILLGAASTAQVEYLVVDDFDSYADNTAIEAVWKDYLYDHGAEVFVETDPNFTRDGNSMKYYYENAYKVIDLYVGSEAEASTADLQVGPDWTAQGVKALTLYFLGDPCNSQDTTGVFNGIHQDQMYLALEDASANVGILKYPDMNAIKEPFWHEWNIELADPCLTDVNMANVSKVYLGFGGQKMGQTKDGAGMKTAEGDIVWFDDIRLYPPRCMPGYGAVTDFTGDCVTDYSDFDIMADEWLISDYEGAPQPPAKAPIIEYLFDEGTGSTTTANTGSYSDPCYNLTIGLYLDANGNSFIHPNHAPLWADDPCRGWCLFFDGEAGMWPGVEPTKDEPMLGGDYLVMPALNLQTDTFSITAWIKPNPTFGKTGDVFKDGFTGIVTTRKHPSINPSVGTEAAGLHFGAGGSFTYNGMLGYTWNDDHHITWNWDSDIFPVNLEWNFVAVTIAPDQATIYDVNESAGALEIASNIIPHSSELLDAKWIIAGNIGHLRFFKGWMDDIRIYDYTLATSEIMNLAGVEGIAYIPNQSVANLFPKLPPPTSYDPCDPDIVDFRDYRIMADNWLKEHMWPPEP